MKGRRYGLAAVIGLVIGVIGTVLGGFCLAQARLASRFVAKELCSCRYVTGQTEAYCQQYARVGPTWGVASSIDGAEKKVRTDAFFFIKASAGYHGPKVGCALDP